jgi:monoamine oxidase
MAEVAIIGAGLAGLAAARTLLEHGVEVAVFEATERVGGRARTATSPDAELPIELGPEFVHGDPDETRALIRDPSIKIVKTAECHHVLQDNRLVPRDDVWKRFGELLHRAEQRSDESAREYIDRVRMKPDDCELFSNIVEGFYGADLARINVASVAEDDGGASGNESPSGYYLDKGYGSVVDSIAAHIPADRIHLGCAVESIDWSSKRIKITYKRKGAHESITVSRVIIAVPLGVLKAKAIDIHPAAFATEIAALEMGHVTKLVMRLRDPLWDGHAAHRLDFVHGATAGFPTYWLRSKGDTHLLTAWAGGKHARALNGVTPDTLLELALDGFAAATRVDRAALSSSLHGRFYHFDYSSHPFTRGAYSYVPVGAGDAIERMSHPCDERLYFAGEATDVDYEGTVVGALRSGKRAAEQVLRRVAHKLAG